MKNKFKIFTVLLFTVALAAFACVNNETPKNTNIAGSNIAANASEKQNYKAAGVIKNIDAKGGKVTIDHEDIPGYMSAMEMTEAVSDKSMLTNLKAGDKASFEIERAGSKVVITKLNKIGEVASISGAEIYKANCAKCHGASGEGAKKGIPLVSGHALHHTEAEHLRQVANGEEDKMPAFKDKLSAAEIKQIVAFVRDDLQKDVRREASRQHKH